MNLRTNELFDHTIPSLLKRNAEQFSNNMCLVAPEFGVRMTWKEFDEHTTVVARGLIAMGINKGDHIGIWASNVPEWLFIFFAAAKVGAVLVTINTNYKQFELEYLLRQSDTKMLVTLSHVKTNNYLEHLVNLIPELNDCCPGEIKSKKFPKLESIILIDEVENKPSGIYDFSSIYNLSEKVNENKVFDIMNSLDTHDVANMQYTSGTTGFPKGVMLTHHNITNNGQFVGDRMNFTPEDRLLVVVPLFHCFGCVLAVMSCLTHASSMVLMNQFNPLKEMEMIVAEKCTAVHGVPTMFIAMLTHPDFDKFDFSNLRTGIMAGSPCPIQTMRDLSEKMNLSGLTITYGQTESSPGMTMSSFDTPLELRVSTVGTLMPQTEGKVIDPETGKECPNGVPGEICTRGYLVMKGYYNMPEATKLAIDEDGWLHTGDIGTVDDDGNYRITGRLKDMIIRGGENIYPREIEEFLYTNTKVKDVQVVGVPDIKYGEEVCACIILKENEIADEDEMISFVKDGLSRFKSPRYILFVDEFPMTASGKIQKYKLRDFCIEKFDLRDAANIETA